MVTPERAARQYARSGADARTPDLFLREAEIELVPVALRHAEVARRAWRRYGKGSHPAASNFGMMRELRDPSPRAALRGPPMGAKVGS